MLQSTSSSSQIEKPTGSASLMVIVNMYSFKRSCPPFEVICVMVEKYKKIWQIFCLMVKKLK